MRTEFDLSPFRRATVGFDRLFDLLESGFTQQASENYPPFDLQQQGEDQYRITLAVAGFRPDEIDVTTMQNQLIVSGRKTEPKDGHYVHRGIATRSFERRFVLGDYVRVDGADLSDGLLSIDLVREIPEAMKPRRIEISSSSEPKQLSDRSDPANQNEERRSAA